MRVGLYDVKKIYNGRAVLSIEKLEFESGRIYAVLGPNGSGKTTMLRILSGIEGADRGSILYDEGESIPSSNISFLMQNPYIFNMNVLENVMLGLENGNQAFDKAKEALDHVGMSRFINCRAHSLSGGEAQRIAVARTLAQGKSLVLLDEPASSADIYSMRLIEEYIKCVNRKNRSTVVFTTHNPSQAFRTADEVVILGEGRVIEMGSAEEVLKNPRAPETREFLSCWGHISDH